MKIEEAKSLILAEWSRWSKKSDPATWQEKFAFFTWLKAERSELVQCMRGKDPWQRIQGWLR